MSAVWSTFFKLIQVRRGSLFSGIVLIVYNKHLISMEFLQINAFIIYHVSKVVFFISGYHYVSTTITFNGLKVDERKSFGYTYIDLEEHIRCEPLFDIPRCHNATRPLHYVTSEVIVLRAVFSNGVPLIVLHSTFGHYMIVQKIVRSLNGTNGSGYD